MGGKKCHKKDKNRTDSFQKGIMGGKNTPRVYTHTKT
jgi:hypothetical protein